MSKDRYIESLAAALLPFVYPDWPMRWGWTEATEDMKTVLRERACEVAEIMTAIAKVTSRLPDPHAKVPPEDTRAL
jgi:hypothetical protein